ncbi:MAG: serine/threonine-protein kinase [Polyangiaceae bacterium]|jgi:eukaryotic-like serine/threonine-protein kinase
MPPLLDAESTVQPGHVLGGKYRVERVLGMGGMGVVVAARHVELQTRFALKLLRREAAADEESVERFLREARAAVKLKSQHCVRIIDVGKLEGGGPYMVMELLVGKDLGELVAESGARSPPEAVDYILQAIEGIAEAHSLGIIHRDIKPQNLFVTRGVDGMPLVKVLDFGLAKSIKSTPEIHALTHTKAVMGSPTYMSPEQMRASRQVDSRSDTWSLGVCLYELLTARTPFEGATYPELCSMVLNEPPSPMPSDIPRGLTRVIVRCLQKDPRRRYADVAELALALEEFASAPGAAARIRAVLDAPRPQLESLHASESHDPNAETKTAASIDTTQRAQNRQHAAGRARSLALGAVGLVIVGGVAFGVAARRTSPPESRTALDPVAVGVATSPPIVTPPSATTAVESSVPVASAAATAATPSAVSAAAAPTVKSGHARGAPTRHAPSPLAAPAPTASAKPSAPVLVPKTTEF